MTDEHIDELMRRINAGDREAQILIDAWIEEALGAVCTSAPIDLGVEVIDPEELSVTVCCGSSSGAFAG